MGGETRRAKSLRIGVHIANAVVWEPVYRTHPTAGSRGDGSNRSIDRRGGRSAYGRIPSRVSAACGASGRGVSARERSRDDARVRSRVFSGARFGGPGSGRGPLAAATDPRDARGALLDSYSGFGDDATRDQTRAFAFVRR
eukprot:31156-Pelagococcus_subviridis.AAC.2